ncbi:hypothetical protein AAVH_42417 [Aphelenchoides avenae]|nr:hypothetical protein AAVH_42417 [Aphelenchus avenae]
MGNIGLNPLHFHHRDLIDLRGDIDVLVDGIEPHQLTTDYFGTTTVKLEAEGSSESARPKSSQQFDWAACNESRFLVCPDKDAQCQVDVHLRQIRSLSAFEARLERIVGLMDAVEAQEMRPFETCRNITCPKEEAREEVEEKGEPVSLS